MIIHSNLPKMKINNLPTCLQGNYRDSSGEFCNTTYGVFVAGRVRHFVIFKIFITSLCWWYCVKLINSSFFEKLLCALLM